MSLKSILTPLTLAPAVVLPIVAISSATESGQAAVVIAAGLLSLPAAAVVGTILMLNLRDLTDHDEEPTVATRSEAPRVATRTPSASAPAMAA